MIRKLAHLFMFTIVLKTISCQFPNSFNNNARRNGIFSNRQNFQNSGSSNCAGGPISIPLTYNCQASDTGLTITSDNRIEGPVKFSGQLPFLGAVELEGSAPSNGMSCVNYACGNEEIGITSEGTNGDCQNLGGSGRFGFRR